MVEATTFKELLSIELNKEIKSLDDLSHAEWFFAKFLYKAILQYEQKKPGEQTLKIKNRTKSLFFSLSYQVDFLKSLYPAVKCIDGRILISEIITSKFSKIKELFE